MKNVYKIDADIKGSKRITAPFITQNDAVSFVVSVFDGGKEVDLSDVATFTLASTRLDKEVVVVAGEHTGVNTVTFDIGTEETKYTGVVKAVVQLYGADGRVSTVSFSYSVTVDPVGDGFIPSERDQTLIEVVLGDGPLVIAEAKDAAEFAREQGDYVAEKKPLIDKFTGEQTNLQTQLDEVSRGATNAETSQARVDTEGVPHATLKTRLDTEMNSVTSQLAEKANINYVDTLMSNITDGSPKELFYSISALTTKYPNGVTGPMLVMDSSFVDGAHSFIWNGTLWVDTGIYQSQGIADKSISERHVNFIQQSENIFDKENSGNMRGYFLSGKNSNLVAEPALLVTHKFYAKPGEVFMMTMSQSDGGAVYGVNDTPILQFGTRLGDFGTAEPYKFTMPTGTIYFRANVLLSRLNEWMIIKGDSFPNDFIPYNKSLTEDIGFNNNQKGQLVELIGQNPTPGDNPLYDHNPLYGKVGAFNGDSIQAGDGEGAKELRRAWAKRIEERNSMVITNRAVGGATIVANTFYPDGVTAKHWLCRDISKMQANADYIILDGGLNDSNSGVAIGVMTSGYTDTYDDTTFTGALESVFQQLYKKYPSKKIGFIITYKVIGSPQWDVFAERIRVVCKKWNIPFLDLYNASGLTVNIPEVRNTLFADSTHINAAGYDATLNKVEAWMKLL